MSARAGHCQHGAMITISDEKLRNTRALLVARGDELRERIQRLQTDLRRISAPLPRDAPDAAIVLENDEILQAVEESARGELDQIERALERIEAGSFASCEVCGAGIDPDRLAIVPYASRCAKCAQDA
jgi:RNA polymerase-binding transcription factor DksA